MTQWACSFNSRIRWPFSISRWLNLVCPTSVLEAYREMLRLVLHHLQTPGVLKGENGTWFKSVQLYLNSIRCHRTVCRRRDRRVVRANPSVSWRCRWKLIRVERTWWWSVTLIWLISPPPHHHPSHELRFSSRNVFLLISKGAAAGSHFHMGSPGLVSSGPHRSFMPRQKAANSEWKIHRCWKSFLSSLRSFSIGRKEKVSFTWAAMGQKNK